MASTNLFLKVIVGWQEVEPDGTECASCGDACHLKMVRGYYQIEGMEKEFVDHVLCGSCDEIIREPENRGDEWKET